MKTAYIPEITERTALLISQGLKSSGRTSWAYEYIVEQLYIDEAASVEAFIKWIGKNSFRASRELPFVESNFRNLYKNYFLKGK